jgi:hypothetical protein
VEDDGDMQFTSKVVSRPKLRCALFVLSAIYGLTGASAHAQNLDQGKSATRLFADTCVTCHRSPRGLAKGRFRATLFMFLQDHYSTSAGTAWELTSYLESLDTPQNRARATGAKSSPRSSARPPASSTRSN